MSEVAPNIEPHPRGRLRYDKDRRMVVGSEPELDREEISDYERAGYTKAEARDILEAE